MQVQLAGRDERQAGGSENRVLERIARGDPLDDCLLDLLEQVEGDSGEITAAICLFDAEKRRVERVVSPSLPEAIRQAVVGLSLHDPAAAPCAMAAFQQAAAVVIDIAADESWRETAWGRLAVAHGFQHCRSTPVMDSSQCSCSTFVLLSRNPDPAAVIDAKLSDSAANLVCIAVERENSRAALRANEERLRLAIEAADLGIWDWDPARGRGSQDRRCRELFGGDLDYDSWKACIHPDDRERAVATFERALESDGPSGFTNEYRVILPDGSVRWIAGFGSVLSDVRDGRRTVTRIIGANLDITRRKAAEADVRQSAERFRMMANATPVLIWMSDLSQGCTYFNQRWLDFTGRAEELEIGRGWLDGVHPDDRTLCERTYSHAFEQRTGFQMEYRLRRADGEYRWLLDCGEPMFSSDGVFAGFIGGCIDIQERKELEDRLRAEESRSRLAMEAAGMGFWDWTIGGKIRWSPDLHRILGLPAALREGTFDDFLACVVPEDRARIASTLERTLCERTDFQAEFRAVTTDGNPRWIAGRGRTLFDEESGLPKRILGVVQDITERRHSEDRLRQNQEELRFALAAAEAAREEAENANRAKDHFLAVLSHELRTPLTPVLMAASTLRMEKDLPESVRFSLDMIQRNIKIEARLIDDLLDLTRIARNRLEFKKKPMDVQSAVHEAIQICRPDIAAANLRLEVCLAARHSLVMGDFARLQQVFWNLIKNGVKFTSSGGLIRIRTENDGSLIRVTVDDDGIGIAPHVLPRIFRPFEQGDADVVRQYGGLGLGLAISLASVEGHGGRLRAESDGPGLGARFVVELETIEEQVA